MVCQYASKITTKERKEMLSRLGRCNSCHQAIWNDEGCFNENCSNGRINILHAKQEERDRVYEKNVSQNKRLSELHSYIQLSKGTVEVLKGKEACRVCGQPVKRRGNRTCSAECALVEQSEYFEDGKSYFAMTREDAEKRIRFYRRKKK